MTKNSLSDCRQYFALVCLLNKRFLYALLVVFVYQWGENLYAQNLDSLEQAIPSMEPNYDKFKAITDLAWAYSRPDPNRALEFAEQARKLAYEHLEEDEQAQSNYYFGAAYKNMGTHQKALEYFEEYKSYYEANMDTQKVCFVYYQTGIVKSMMGDYAEAIEDLYVNIRLAQQLGYKDTEANTLNAIATIYKKMKDYSNSIRLNKEAYAIFEKNGDRMGMAQCLLNNGNTYAEQDKSQESMVSMEQALKLALEENHRHMILYCYLNLGNLLTNMEEWGRAKKYFDQALELSIELNNGKAEEGCYLGLGTLFLRTEKPKEAIVQFEKAFNITKKNNSLENQVKAVKGLAKSYEASNQFPQSIENYKLLNILSDSLLNKDITEQVASLNVQYETERKEARIELLEKDKLLAQRKQGIWALAATVLVILALAFGILFRNRQKSVEKLEAKNRVISKMLEEKEYLVKEIHHRVKNNLQIISSLLQLQSRYIEEPSALAALSDGENRVRSMSIIHQHLYTDDHLSQVYLPSYVNNLCESLKASYSIGNKKIDLVKKAADCYLDVGVMVPLGLILNELVTNAFKYAFEGREQGTIRIEISENGDMLQVNVDDDGVGIDPTKQQGFGSRLIKSFLKKLEAEAKIHVNNGTHIAIEMRVHQTQKVQKQTA